MFSIVIAIEWPGPQAWSTHLQLRTRSTVNGAMPPPPPQVTMEWCFSMQPQLPTVSDNGTMSNMRLDTCKCLTNVGGSTKSNRDAGYCEYYHCFSQSLKEKTDKTPHQATTTSFHASSNSLLGAFAYSPKNAYHFRRSARISSAPTGWTSVEFATGAFYEKPVEKIQIRLKLSILHLGVSRFYSRQRQRIALRYSCSDTQRHNAKINAP